jgi:hypothetical protein
VPLCLHCIGGFVVSFHYGLPRTTGDIDYYSAIPANTQINDFAGRGSELHKKYKVYLQRVTVTTLPEDYDSRLVDMFPGRFKQLQLLAPDPYDLILSKIERNGDKDRHDANYLFKTLKLDARVLRDRYAKELRPNLLNPHWPDMDIEHWIEMFEETP